MRTFTLRISLEDPYFDSKMDDKLATLLEQEAAVLRGRHHMQHNVRVPASTKVVGGWRIEE